ncbi:MAG: sigma-70 family RNA polymerase sigma factor [Saprospiraceae bacterium]
MEFSKQIWPFKDQLFRFALRLVNDRDDAEDVVQEVMIKLWKQGQELLKVQNMEAWCMKLTRNQALDRLKSGYTKRKTTWPQDLALTEQGNEPDKQLETADTLAYIRQLMEALPENHRSVIHLRDVEGMSYQEIADVLDMTMPQVKTNLFRARNTLKSQLIKHSEYGR